MREMKDSGISYVGLVPSHWATHPVYFYYGERKSKNSLGKEENLLSLSYGKIVRKDINSVGGLLPESYNTYNIVEKGDIIIRPTDLQNDKTSLRTGLVTEHGIITSAYIALKPKTDLVSSYFNYLLHAFDVTKVFYNMGNGVRQGLNYSEFSKLMVFEPPLPEQHAIADFLDRKCAEIETLAADIQAQIDTLEQYKRSVITEAVTKGLNPDAEMRDSGIAWVGSMPSSWRKARIKTLFRIEKRIARKEGIRVLSITQRGVVEKDITSNEGQQAESYANYQIVNYGDFAMNHMDLLTGWIDISQLDGVTSPDYRVFTLNDNKCFAEYYLFLFQMCYLNRIFYGLGQGVSGMGRWRLPASMFMNMELPIPDTNEQREIANYLNTECSEIDSVIADKQQQLATLDEYKKSLIYEYVTGKKEVAV